MMMTGRGRAKGSWNSSPCIACVCVCVLRVRLDYSKNMKIPSYASVRHLKDIFMPAWLAFPFFPFPQARFLSLPYMRPTFFKP